MVQQIAIIGAGPAGLMAAEVLGAAGFAVTVYDAMPTFGRKFLLAGKSGLNLTHSEDFVAFAGRFGAASTRLRPALEAFRPQDVRQWALSLGIETFVGTSGRVFPNAMKASPLLRAWLRRLESSGVVFRPRHRWIGFDGDGLRIATPDGETTITPDAALLSLGGASWPRLGSDARWLPFLEEKGVAISPFRPANCGFDVSWSEIFCERFAGAPVKSVCMICEAGAIRGEFVITRHGVEGSLVYAHSAALRDELTRRGRAQALLDLAPDRTRDRIARDLARQDGKASLSNRLRKAARLEGAKAALLKELVPEASRMDPADLAGTIKALPVPLLRPRPIEEAISSAGGVRWDDVDGTYMLKASPGLFVAGEMLDWEAPTGGYLLNACFATGRAAAQGIVSFLNRRPS